MVICEFEFTSSFSCEGTGEKAPTDHEICSPLLVTLTLLLVKNSLPVLLLGTIDFCSLEGPLLHQIHSAGLAHGLICCLALEVFKLRRW